jgi:hypothetical protein
MKKTSVPIRSVRSSPVAISGLLFQKAALSITVRSRTTSQSSFAMASRCSRAPADPTAGFCPHRK